VVIDLVRLGEVCRWVQLVERVDSSYLTSRMRKEFGTLEDVLAEETVWDSRGEGRASLVRYLERTLELIIDLLAQCRRAPHTAAYLHTCRLVRIGFVHFHVGLAARHRQHADERALLARQGVGSVEFRLHCTPLREEFPWARELRLGGEEAVEVRQRECLPHRQRHELQRMRAHHLVLERRERVDVDKEMYPSGTSAKFMAGHSGGQVDGVGEAGSEALQISLQGCPRRRTLPRTFKVLRLYTRLDERRRLGIREVVGPSEVALEIAGDFERGGA
jgi:hypothetical protein